MQTNQNSHERNLSGVKKYSMRQVYQLKLFFRIIVAMVCFMLYIFRRETFHVLSGWEFFHKFSWLHLIWAVWVANMLTQLIPGSSPLLLGSRKQFNQHYQQMPGLINKQSLLNLIHQGRQARIKVAGIWLLLTGLIAGLRFSGILDVGKLFLLTAVFYVCDLICVLIWCPFRSLIMKNRCCTTCLIFNWDYTMVFTPAVFIGGFFAISLFVLSLSLLISWEIRLARHPQRFFDQTNKALTCESCLDRVCEKTMPN